MDKEPIEQRLEAPTTRRSVVKTGVKLAYAAPLVAASFSLTEAGALAAPKKRPGPKKNASKKRPAAAPPKPPVGGTGADNGKGKGATKIAICHATCSNSNPYVLIEIDDNAVAAHTANHHKHCPNTDVVLGPAANGYTQADCPGGAISGA